MEAETCAKKDRIMRTSLSTFFTLSAAVSLFGGCSNSGSETATDRAAGDSFADCDICPEMVVIPAGEFMMGSPETEKPRRKSEGPQHRVTISAPFAMGKYEVTYGEYAKFVEATGHKSGQSCVVWAGRVGGESLDGKSWRDPNFPQTDRSPVTCITWPDAKAYAAWLSDITGQKYDLPTEAQWEYAVRGGTTTSASFPGGPDDVCKYANTSDLSAKENGGGSDWKYANCYDGYGTQSAPVGSYLPNPFGLYDMYGNVWEWTLDCYQPGYEGAPTDGSAWITTPCESYAVRGSSLSAPPDNLRSAVRSRGSSYARTAVDIKELDEWHNWNLGVRVVRVLN